MEILASNKKISFLYNILERVEAGIVLQGCEVKSLKQGKVSLNGSFISIVNGEVVLKNCEIQAYTNADGKLDTKRERKLLLHKAEINKLDAKVKEKGLTLVPDKIYLKNGLVKLEIALCRGKHSYDKKESIKQRDITRELSRNYKVK